MGDKRLLQRKTKQVRCQLSFNGRCEGVEPTNNPAKRILRRGVLWRKRSFGPRSERGARYAERILTVVRTRRLQGKRVFPFLVEALEAYRAGKAAPSLCAEEHAPWLIAA